MATRSAITKTTTRTETSDEMSVSKIGIAERISASPGETITITMKITMMSHVGYVLAESSDEKILENQDCSSSFVEVAVTEF